MERGKGKGKVRETASITKGKNIVIWGIGALQSDLEGACAFEQRNFDIKKEGFSFG